jgi:hypothetical protein
MIAAGYMAKHVVARTDWISAGGIKDIYSVSGCISEDFADYINFWKHNGFWLFDSAEIISAVAKEAGTPLDDTRLFYYEVFENQFDQVQESWSPFEPEASFRTEVSVPSARVLEGYDVVNFFAKTSPECSPLSCNNLAGSLVVNEHCLFSNFEEAFAAVESGAFRKGEPGPLRIFAVFSVQEAWPTLGFESALL